MMNYLKKKNKILISGYYGYNNIGDEAILKGLIDGIRKLNTNIDITVLSKHPEFTQKKYNVKAVYRSNIYEITKAIKNADLVISGGGSLFQDITSKKSIIYYLAILKLAQMFKKKTFIYSQGIGPINVSFNRFLTKKIFEKVDFINVRDKKSEIILRDLGINNDVLVTIDTVFGINKPNLDIGKKILDDLKVDNENINIGLIVIDWKKSKERTIRVLEKTINNILSENKKVNIILIPFYYYQDLDIENEIYENIKNKFENIFLIKKYLKVNECLSIIGNLDIVISMRLHGLIFSTLMGAYPIGISYDPKIDAFLNELNRKKEFDIDSFTSKELVKKINFAIENIDELKKNTKENLDKFYNLTEIHNKAVINILEK